jgi:membrane protein
MNGTRVGFIREIYAEWRADNAPLHGAALSYYTILSASPLLFLAVALAGVVFGSQAAEGQVVEQIQDLVGDRPAAMIQSMIAGVNVGTSGLVVGLLGLFFTASRVFARLRNSLSQIWGASPQSEGGFWSAMKGSILGFLMVFVLGGLLLISLVLSTILSGLRGHLDGLLSGGLSGRGLTLIQIGISFVIFTLLFAMIYKILPEVEISRG